MTKGINVGCHLVSARKLPKFDFQLTEFSGCYYLGKTIKPIPCLKRLDGWQRFCNASFQILENN
jgi:hypothetical protein